ncbi:hypothetical protein [Luteococcus sp. OSA5]|uniref:hypothetical protein n=1 Tax=Luteococcus sp. OSA5 TaxID=3401630 RepID=UPI003B431775
MNSRLAETAPRRPKRLNLATVIILLAALAFAFTLRGHVALQVANATGQTSVHSARITAISDGPWFKDFCDPDKRQRRYEIHVQWSEPESASGSYSLCLKEHERRAKYVGQTQQVMSEPWLGTVARAESPGFSLFFAVFLLTFVPITVGLAIWLFRPETTETRAAQR